MSRRLLLTFAPFHLDAATASLWRGTQRLALRRRAIAVLQYLLEHPGQCIASAALLQHVWAGTHVSRTVLKVCIREIRTALGDTATAPRYIETVGRQGYRFCGVVTAAGLTAAATHAPLPAPPLLDRPEVVAHLWRWWDHATMGRRWLGVLSGEAGMGKSTVVTVFLRALAATGEVYLAQGQCVEAYGRGAPYLPLLDALSALVQSPFRDDVVTVFRQQAPTWAVHVSGLLPEAEHARLQSQVHGATPARMLREFAEALEGLAAPRPVVLVLEDVHWSDGATLQALATVMQRQTPARLLVVGTYRPAELRGLDHPWRCLLQEWQGRGVSEDLAVPPLTAPEVAAYVASRLGGTVPAGLLALIYQRTEGHALFVTRLVEHLLQQGVVRVQDGHWTVRPDSAQIFTTLPAGLRPLITRQVARLGPLAQRVLEAASVVGEHFTAAAVAAGLQCDVETVEAWCDTITQVSHLLDAEGLMAWPDGTWSSRYRFRHTLYRQVLYEQLGAGRRLWLHRRIGRRLETAYGTQVQELAAELAVHFLHGREPGRALGHLTMAAEDALAHSAYQEALVYCHQGRELLPAVADAHARVLGELRLLRSMRLAVASLKGYLAPELPALLQRARTLGQQVHDGAQWLALLVGLVIFYTMRGEVQTAHDLATERVLLAQQHDASAYLGEALFELGRNGYMRGAFTEARQHLERALPLCDRMPAPQTPLFGHLLLLPVYCRTYLAWVLWTLGYADQAQRHMREALRLARRSGHAFVLAHTYFATAILHIYRGDVEAGLEQVEVLLPFATAQGFPLWIASGLLVKGKALARLGQEEAGRTLMQQAWIAYQQVSNQGRSGFLVALAETHRQPGRVAEGLAFLREARAVMAHTGERVYAAEIARVHGELTLVQPGAPPGEAEVWLQEALTIARQQQAKAWELRAAQSLCRLLAQQGKRQAAYQVLAEVYNGFTEGFDTGELRQARQWLQALNATERSPVQTG